jgi:hypothetical protein
LTVWGGHPAAPAELHDVVERLVERNLLSVSRALATIEPDSPIFAICFRTGDDPEDVTTNEIYVGVERDRVRLLAERTPWEGLQEVWNPINYSYEASEVDDPSEEVDYQVATKRVVEWLDAQAMPMYSRWVLEETAARLSRNPPPLPYTDDFITYVYEHSEDVMPSLRWIAPPRVQRLLERKQLLVDDASRLAGAPRYDDLT